MQRHNVLMRHVKHLLTWYMVYRVGMARYYDLAVRLKQQTIAILVLVYVRHVIDVPGYKFRLSFGPCRPPVRQHFADTLYFVAWHSRFHAASSSATATVTVSVSSSDSSDSSSHSQSVSRHPHSSHLSQLHSSSNSPHSEHRSQLHDVIYL